MTELETHLARLQADKTTFLARRDKSRQIREVIKGIVAAGKMRTEADGNDAEFYTQRHTAWLDTTMTAVHDAARYLGVDVPNIEATPKVEANPDSPFEDMGKFPTEASQRKHRQWLEQEENADNAFIALEKEFDKQISEAHRDIKEAAKPKAQEGAQ